MFRDISLTVLTPWALPVPALVFLLLIAWSFVWKGMALWRAARLNEYYWFVALLIVNSVGILDILYLYVFSQRKRPAALPQP